MSFSMDFLDVLRERPIIAAFRDVKSLKIEELDRIGVLFILGGTIFDLPDIIDKAVTSGKLVFVDIDLIKGVGKDAPGIQYLAREIHVHGIITTRSNLIKSAQKEKMISVQRIFVLDSESLTGGLNVIEKSTPDAVEILPGLILPKIMDRIRERVSVPVIAGGLITKCEEIQEILSSGAIGVSTTTSSLFAFQAPSLLSSP
ncbi:MAG: glycerol-3-phosphate responsive antiterminator [Deltaproteobacteria bacterium]|nr:MAG: glycerol-3-phosphate responsive antiterminator [Deltaproteobacteria bacterium]